MANQVTGLYRAGSTGRGRKKRTKLQARTYTYKDNGKVLTVRPRNPTTTEAMDYAKHEIHNGRAKIRSGLNVTAATIAVVGTSAVLGGRGARVLKAGTGAAIMAPAAVLGASYIAKGTKQSSFGKSVARQYGTVASAGRGPYLSTAQRRAAARKRRRVRGKFA